MPLVLVTPPVGEVLSLPEVKQHLRVDHTADDALIAALITAARQHLEGADGWLNRALMTQTWDLTLDTLPSTIYLPLAPVASISSLKYLDTVGVEQTFSALSYRTDLAASPPSLTTGYGVSWPSTYGVTNAVTVRFVAGYGATPATVPQPIKAAMKLLIAGWYAIREPSPSDAMPTTVETLLMPYRVWPRAA